MEHWSLLLLGCIHYVYHRGGRGFFFGGGGVLKNFLKGKGGMVKISEGRKGEGQFFKMPLKN